MSLNYLLGKGGYAICSVGVSVCLLAKKYEWIATKCYGRPGLGQEKEHEQVIRFWLWSRYLPAL